MLTIKHKQPFNMIVFQITPKRIKRVNGTVLTAEMTVMVTSQMHTPTPFL